jgi:hypothetical protein
MIALGRPNPPDFMSRNVTLAKEDPYLPSTYYIHFN